MTKRPVLENRSVINIEGKDCYSLLQALITNDIYILEKTSAIYTALLNHQGKYLFDFFIIKPQQAETPSVLLDVEKERVSLLLKYLNLYKLRLNVTITDVSGTYAVAALLDNSKFDRSVNTELVIEKSFFYKDPRVPQMGWRFLIHKENQALIQDCVQEETYQLHRLKQGIVESAHDLIAEKSVILEYGFDQLQAISWNKGCYLGQELMARTKHRGMIHKRIFCVDNSQGLPPKGTEILLNQQKIGQIVQHQDGFGVALIRFEEGENLAAIQSRIDLSTCAMTIKTPAWWPL